MAYYTIWNGIALPTYSTQVPSYQVLPYQPYATSVYLPAVTYQDPYTVPVQVPPRAITIAPPPTMVGGFFGTMMQPTLTTTSTITNPTSVGGTARVYPLHVQTPFPSNLAYILP